MIFDIVCKIPDDCRCKNLNSLHLHYYHQFDTYSVFTYYHSALIVPTNIMKCEHKAPLPHKIIILFSLSYLSHHEHHYPTTSTQNPKNLTMDRLINFTFYLIAIRTWIITLSVKKRNKFIFKLVYSTFHPGDIFVSSFHLEYFSQVTS